MAPTTEQTMRRGKRPQQEMQQLVALIIILKIVIYIHIHYSSRSRFM
jgi:hypothetical protein